MKRTVVKPAGVVLLLGGLFISACSPQPVLTPEPTPTIPVLTRQEALATHQPLSTPDPDPSPPRLHLNGWQEAVPLPGAVNTAGYEDSPFILPDGQTLYFFFTPDAAIPPEEQLRDGVTGIYVSHREGDAWSEPQRVLLQDPGRLALDGCAFIQDQVIWFCSAREGFNGINWFTASLAGERPSGWQAAGSQFPPEFEVGELHISADGQELFFHSRRTGGLGGMDIWLSRMANGVWSPPENIAAVNSADDEGWPALSPDGSELWFTRYFEGSPAIFRSMRGLQGWSIPSLILSSFSGEPSLDEAGNIYFVHHIYQDGQPRGADIYVAVKE